jgi:Zn-dependent metalloprotease
VGRIARSRLLPLAFAIALASPAPAVPLDPGNSVALSGAPGEPGAVIRDDLLPFEIWDLTPSGASVLMFEGVLQARIVELDAGANLLFSFRIRDTNPALPGAIQRIDLRHFDGVTTDVDFATNGLGSVGPTSADRSPDGKSVEFVFGTPLVGGEESFFLEITTDATAFELRGKSAIVPTAGSNAPFHTAQPAASAPDPRLASLAQLSLASQSAPQVRFEAGVPAFLAVDVPVAPGTAMQAPTRALTFLDDFKDLYGLPAPLDDLHLMRWERDEVGDHLFFGQHVGDVAIDAAQIAVHLEGESVRSVSANSVPGERPSDLTPVLDARQAEAVALGDAPGDDLEVAGPGRLVLHAPDPFSANTDLRLAWRVVVDGIRSGDGPYTSWLYHVDARDGSVLLTLDQLRTESIGGDRPDEDIDIETANDTMSRRCWRGLVNQSDQNWFTEAGPLPGYPGAAGDNLLEGQKVGANPSGFSHQTYHYLFDTFGFRSWNGRGDQIQGMVHARTTSMGQNAFYFSRCDLMVFNDGIVTADVVAHEFGHGISDKTAELRYKNESGALSESFADLFGTLVEFFVEGEAGDWLIAEDRTDPAGMPLAPFRSMMNPQHSAIRITSPTSSSRTPTTEGSTPTAASPTRWPTCWAKAAPTTGSRWASSGGSSWAGSISTSSRLGCVEAARSRTFAMRAWRRPRPTCAGASATSGTPSRPSTSARSRTPGPRSGLASAMSTATGSRTSRTPTPTEMRFQMSATSAR